ncbi:hypothetical protein, partial [Spongiibacter tropicus]|uniref:hypothetical protein n=1 Tax=Spongiibacter tropicus TaxID=454602 RepID=UPI003A98F8EB
VPTVNYRYTNQICKLELSMGFTGRLLMVGNQGGEMELFGTINNLFDNEAPIIPATTPGATYPTLIGTYDYVGRAFTVGMRYTF